MKRLGKVLALVVAAVVALVLYAAVAGPGQFTPAKATFVRPNIPGAYQLANDVEPAPGEYAYVDLGKNFSNCWIFFGGNGSFTMSVSRGLDRKGKLVGRYVDIAFVKPPLVQPPIYGPDDPHCYPNYPSDPSIFTVRAVFIRTQGEYTAAGEALDNILNVMAMAPGETRYATIWFWHEVLEDGCRYDWRGYPAPGLVQIEAMLDVMGKKCWVMKPYSGQTARKLTRDAYACDLGVWPMDFELQIALK